MFSTIYTLNDDDRKKLVENIRIEDSQKAFQHIFPNQFLTRENKHKIKNIVMPIFYLAVACLIIYGVIDSRYVYNLLINIFAIVLCIVATMTIIGIPAYILWLMLSPDDDHRTENKTFALQEKLKKQIGPDIYNMIYQYNQDLLNDLLFLMEAKRAKPTITLIKQDEALKTLVYSLNLIDSYSNVKLDEENKQKRDGIEAHITKDLKSMQESFEKTFVDPLLYQVIANIMNKKKTDYYYLLPQRYCDKYVNDLIAGA